MAHNEHYEELAVLQALRIPLGSEAADFARHLAECGVCAAAVAEAASAATVLAVNAPPVKPRAEVRSRILEEVRRESGVGNPESEIEARSAFPRWALALAAALAIVFLVWDDAHLRREREELRGRSAELSDRLETAQKGLARRDLQVRVLESEDVRVLFLGGKDPQPDARAKVFWSAKARRGVLVAANLAPLPAGKQYELWVFSKGKPVAAGVFDADPSGRLLGESSDLSSIDTAENFAVTIEPRGGVSAPTGPIVLVGGS